MIASLIALAVSAQCAVCHHPYVKGATLTRDQFHRIVGSYTSRASDKRGLEWIARRESSLKPTAKNPRSSAYGLFQFLGKTWKGTGVSKTSCPKCQTKAALRYIKARYGTIEKAIAHHRAKGWY